MRIMTDTAARQNAADPHAADERSSATSPDAEGTQARGMPHGETAASPNAESSVAPGEAAALRSETLSRNAARRKRGAVFVAAVALAALATWGAFKLDALAPHDGRSVLIVDGDGAEYTMPLDVNAERTFSTELGSNTVRVENGSVFMEDADCPGGDCIEQGAVSDESGVIVCMPHRLIVRIVDSEETR